jgi:hypothetical protein
MKVAVFWDMWPCGSSKKNQRFGETYRLHPQGNETLSFLNLKMEAIQSSETSVLLARGTWRQIAGDNLHCYRREMSQKIAVYDPTRKRVYFRIVFVDGCQPNPIR